MRNQKQTIDKKHETFSKRFGPRTNPLRWLLGILMKFSFLMKSLEENKKVSLMHNFRKTMEICSFHDLRHSGNFFTWSNRYVKNIYTKERLDGAMANVNCAQIYNSV